MGNCEIVKLSRKLAWIVDGKLVRFTSRLFSACIVAHALTPLIALTDQQLGCILFVVRDSQMHLQSVY